MTAPVTAPRSHRGTLFEEAARVLAHDAFDGEQYLLRVAAPRCAATAQPGQFAHLAVDRQRPMRRPLSIMRVDAEAGWVEFLYKIVGDGTRLLAQRRPGDVLQSLGPIGRPFDVTAKRPLLLGGGVGMPPMIFLADRLRGQAAAPFVVLGSEVPFPFRARPSQMLVDGMPPGVIGTMPLLEDWDIPCRLASGQGYAGAFDGYVTDLARHWLDALDKTSLGDVEIYGCGPEPMLAATVALAREYRLPVQISLEEYMACAVGGCAGCTVRIATPDGPAMKRVCVDGPVFDGYSVYPEAD